MDEIEKSLSYINSTLEAIPNNAEALNMKGELLMVKDLSNEATTYFTRAIHANPKLESAWFNKAIILEREGAVSEALYNLDMVLKINPGNSNAKNLRSIILQVELRPKKVWLFVGTEETWNELSKQYKVHTFLDVPDLKTQLPKLQDPT